MLDQKKLLTKILTELKEQSHSRFVYTQGIASSVWTITHNMNCYPSVTIVDTAKQVVVGQISYIDANSLTVTFKAAFKGTAYLN